MIDDTRTAVVVEDDPDIRELLIRSLQLQGFTVHAARTGWEALDLVSSTSPDLVTLDLGLPDLDGVEVCRRIRQASTAYIVMVSARGEEIDRLVGLETGADDFLTKPFSPRELQARVTAMFRRPRVAAPAHAPADPAIAPPPAPDSPAPAPAGVATLARPLTQPVTTVAGIELPPPAPGASVIRHGSLQVDPESRTVTVEGAEVELTRTEFDLLTTMLSAPRRVWGRDVLLRSLWGEGWESDDHLVEVHVGNLRRKLARSSRAGSRAFIRTVRGVGYRMEEPA
ncbi:MAG TPA: response regulator transcription factor [Intrasporangium sp.]|uniref:response regulator transcription factor n=1 Tax=Intrasporangium sp. TaxID=1925024 RepID=UPI002D76A84D|nr:response regulator transcription factor [Intrasporangium sp.]HET7399320.1 response regulator transcription factor [Intrasporangium sp.]